MDIQEIRNKYPQYNDLSNQELADKFHQKFYADMPQDEFYQKIGFSAEPANISEQQNLSWYENPLLIQSLLAGAGKHLGNINPFASESIRNMLNETYEKSKAVNPGITEAGDVLSQIYTSIPFGMAGGYAVGLPGMLAGQFAHGLATRPEEGEDRLINAATETAYAGLPFAAGKALKAASPIVSKIPGSLSKTKIAEKIIGTLGESESKLGSAYDALFSEAEALGAKTNLASKVANPNLLSKNIDKKLEGVDKITRNAVKKAYGTDSLSKVKEARTELSDFIRQESAKKAKNMPFDRAALKEAQKMNKELGKELKNALDKIGLGEQYSGLNKQFAKEVIPYRKIPAMYEYKSGDITSKDFIRALQGEAKSGKRFRALLNEKHPEVKINKILENALKWGIGSGLGYGAYKEIIK